MRQKWIASGCRSKPQWLGALLAFSITGFCGAYDPPPSDEPYVVTTSEDVSGDTVNDAVVAAPLDGGTGEVRIVSGTSGDLAVVLVGKQAGSRFGRAAVVARKISPNQYKGLIVGAPLEGAGRAYVFLGPFDESCPLILSAHYANLTLGSPDEDTFSFGESLNSIPDVDDDGISEVLVRASFTTDAGGTGYRTYVFSGASGANLYKLDGDATSRGYVLGPPSVPLSCYGDITGAGGLPDGVVNVNDMLLVILSWGQCPELPVACPADIAPRNPPNGIVNTDDLLAVLNAWGPCPPEGITYQSNGTGGGDWFDPESWNPPGVPGMNQHFDVVRILPGDTITQAQKYPYTLGYYLLESGGTHVFAADADVAALSVEPYGYWLRSNEMEPTIVVRNAREAYMPPHADVVRVYDCPTFCALLAHPRYPFTTLPTCIEIPCPPNP